VGGRILEEKAPVDSVIEDALERRKLVVEGLRRSNGATVSRPALAVCPGDVPDWQLAEERFQRLQGDLASEQAAGLKLAGGVLNPAGRDSGERKP